LITNICLTTVTPKAWYFIHIQRRSTPSTHPQERGGLRLDMMIVELGETQVFGRFIPVRIQKPPHDLTTRSPTADTRKIRATSDIEVTTGRLTLRPVWNATCLVGIERRKATFGIPALPELLWIGAWGEFAPQSADSVVLAQV
jgi:hypothetical protein